MPARISPDGDGGGDAGGPPSSSSPSSSSPPVDRSLLDSLRSMRAMELKVELDSLSVPTRGILEKEELVRRLYDARIVAARRPPRQTSAADDDEDDDDDAANEGKKETSKKKKKKCRRRDDDDDDEDDVDGAATPGGRHAAGPPPPAHDGARTGDVGKRRTIIATPFTYFELGPSGPVVAAARSRRDGADDGVGTVCIRPSRGRYAAIKVQLTNKEESSSSSLSPSNADAVVVEWTLLVDTACSGLVLSPDAVRRANDNRPGTMRVTNNAGTMTMAGSSSLGTTSVASWDEGRYRMTVGGGEEIVGNGSNVAACQDIGALPAGLDGIIGLSLLGRYDRVDFDYANGELRLSSNREIDDDDDPRDVPNGDGDAVVVVARCALRLTRLRVYAADVTLDGRGPVGMLVDTGASSTFLNRRGVSDMRLSMHSPPLIEPIRGEAIGAMGADNLALRLTHRYRLRRRWNLVAENTSLGGLGLAGVEIREGGGEGDGRNIDIGDLPVLEALGGDGVGGILGADLLMMCDVVRFSGLNTGSPTMILMQR